jgi:ABC-2 type transport system permease protein
MNIVFTPYGWEWRIREGELSAALLPPAPPAATTTSRASPAGRSSRSCSGFPIAAVLWIAFDPVLERPRSRSASSARDLGRLPDPDDVHVVAGDDHVLDDARQRDLRARVALELLLSGRLVPLPLMPDWRRTSRAFCPFQWSFYFPIQALVGDYSTRELLEGLAMQAFWIAVLTGLTLFVWRFAVRRYSAVGN